MKTDLRKLWAFILILFLSLASFLTASTNSLAQETSLSLGYAPTALYIDLDQGQQYEGEATFWNLASRTISFEIQVKGFAQIEEFPGTSRILTDQEEANDPYSASKWFFVQEKTVTISPNSSQKIKYTVSVPEDAANGEHHATIFLLSSEQARGTAPGSQALTDLGSGPAILINVGDEINENAQLLKFESDKKFYEQPPVTFLTQYKNAGNTHITPAGDIVLENFLGQEIERITFNENKQSVLRGNLATYENVWENSAIFFKNGKIAIGPIKARLITTYRSVNPGFAPLSATISFWVLPWKYILAAIVILALVYRQTLGKRVSRLGTNGRKRPLYSEIESQGNQI
jgi:hypothetical protein